MSIVTDDEITVYQIDTMIQINASFYNVAANQLVDPTNLALFLLDPNNNETTVNPALIVRTGIGEYYYNFLPPSAGLWAYKWQGTGDITVTSRDMRFFVQGSELI